MDRLADVAGQFIPQGLVADIREFGRGNINRTFLVTPEAAGESPFILQRLNTQVFRQPELVMRNMAVVAGHVSQRLARTPLPEGRRWEVVRVLLTREGHDLLVDATGSCWRAISFIAAARSLETITVPAQASEVGWALGTFHSLLSDLPPEQLADPLPGFHITPLYLQHYDEVLASHGAGESPEVKYCLRFVEARRTGAHVLEQARARGRLPLRPIHGDPKVNNIMMDAVSGLAVGMVDLDTIKPGLVHYDLGDCLRSACNPLGEDPEDWEAVRFETDLGRAILQGYLGAAGGFLADEERAYLYDAVRLIAFELGLRFLTDFLEGNVYFNTRDFGQNLRRALVQFRLVESIESQATAIRSMVNELP